MMTAQAKAAGLLDGRVCYSDAAQSLPSTLSGEGRGRGMAMLVLVYPDEANPAVIGVEARSVL